MDEKLINNPTISSMVLTYLKFTRPDLDVKLAHLAVDKYGYKAWYCKKDRTEGCVYFATTDENETLTYIKLMTLQAS